MELLAPAGTFDCLKAAVNSGADAVYFAGKSFGARSYAGNFGDDEIFAAVDYCHLRNAKAYVTVNTMAFDREFDELEKAVKILTKAGADGVIVQDLGVLRFIRDVSPDMELHASTQMTVHSADGVRELENLGVSRVVLSRELSGTEIADITRSVSAETEVFVHGAMCMSYSGQCLMSSVIGGRSGNRGKCAQPCRLTFSPGGKNPRHYLSLKDMSYASHIAEMADMGVASLKIEGRMKGAEYVSEVVSIYRKLIDEMRAPTSEERERLNKVFFRGGLSDGYYTGRKGKHMFAFDKPDNPYLKNKEAISIPKDKQVEAELCAYIKTGAIPKIILKSGTEYAEVCGGEPIAKAENQAATVQAIRTRLSKTGGTPFKITNFDIELSNDAFVPVAVLNDLRRTATEALEKKIVSKYKNKRICKYNYPTGTVKASADGKFTCSVLSIEQYRVIKNYDFKYIYVPAHIVAENTEELMCDNERIIVSPPVILRADDRERYINLMRDLRKDGFDKAEIHTLDTISVCKGFKLCGGHRLNTSNTFSAAEYGDMGIESICLSPEMNAAQMRDVGADIVKEVIVYGRIPLMITENCILKNMDKCPCGGKDKLVDRTGTEYAVTKDGDICRSVVLNSVPLYAADKLEKVRDIRAEYYKIVFTVEKEEMCGEICDAYLKGKQAEVSEYTRLNLFKSALM